MQFPLLTVCPNCGKNPIEHFDEIGSPIDATACPLTTEQAGRAVAVASAILFSRANPWTSR